VRCGATDKVAVTLKAPKKAKKALKRLRGSLKATVTITMGTGAEATTDRATLTLKGKQK
jgi:hypothetical protein